MKIKYTDSALLKNEDDSCYVPIREVQVYDEQETKAVVLFEGKFYDVKKKDLYEKKD